jgi:hypothetical protein
VQITTLHKPFDFSQEACVQHCLESLADTLVQHLPLRRPNNRRNKLYWQPAGRDSAFGVLPLRRHGLPGGADHL